MLPLKNETNLSLVDAITTIRRKFNLPEPETPIEMRFYHSAPPALRELLEGQYKIGGFRFDWALPVYKILIELDGHQWHHTLEQRAHDARKARFAQKLGWRVVRFTGTEIHRNPDTCISELLDITADPRWDTLQAAITLPGGDGE
jgi:hypothetical protein